MVCTVLNVQMLVFMTSPFLWSALCHLKLVPCENGHQHSDSWCRRSLHQLLKDPATNTEEKKEKMKWGVWIITQPEQWKTYYSIPDALWVSISKTPTPEKLWVQKILKTQNKKNKNTYIYIYIFSSWESFQTHSQLPQTAINHKPITSFVEQQLLFDELCGLQCLMKSK